MSQPRPNPNSDPGSDPVPGRGPRAGFDASADSDSDPEPDAARGSDPARGCGLAGLSDPASLDTFEFARTGGHLHGQVPIASLPRLADSLQPTPEAALGAVDWTLDGSVGARPGGGPAQWLDLHARFDAPMQCMRCLEPVVAPVRIQRRFKLERDARAVELEPLDEDAFDLLLGSARFDALALLEDEALLALPLVPRHDDCALPAGASEAADEPVRASPFAALAGLRRAAGPADD